VAGGDGVFTLQSIKSRIETTRESPGRPGLFLFLLYSPLNQGLKRSGDGFYDRKGIVFTLQSIKSRIETSSPSHPKQGRHKFLLYSPLNQGLKLPG